MKKKGFTLIELMVVCAIIAVLAVVVVMSYAGAKAKTRDTRRISDLSLIADSLQLYYNDNNNFATDDDYVETSAGISTTNPTTATAPTGSDWKEGSATDRTIKFDLYPNYISKMPIDPKNTGHYNYSYEPDYKSNPSLQNNYDSKCSESGVGSICAFMLSATLENTPANSECDACYKAHNYCLPSQGGMVDRAECL